MLLLLKIVLAPMHVAIATLVARRWGPRIGGIVVGLPLSTGPIFLFLASPAGRVRRYDLSASNIWAASDADRSNSCACRASIRDLTLSWI